MFSDSWSGYRFSVCNALKCLCLRVLLQSKWPFGKASRVIIVNYSVKLRVPLRGKQSEWAIFSSTSWESSLIPKQTSLADPGCRRIGSGSKRKRNKYRNCAYTCLSHTSIHYPAHSHPQLLCSSLWERLMSQNEGWSGSTGKLGERKAEGRSRRKNNKRWG